MTPRIRPTRPPRAVIACWAAASVCGAASVAAASAASPHSAQTLAPTTLAHYFQRVAGTDAHDIRVNGVYGSAHDGAWQFVAHLTWRDQAGRIHGGRTELPTLAGSPTLASEFTDSRLTVEEDLGWSLSTLTHVLDRLPHMDAPLALVELQITPSAATVTSCWGDTTTTAECVDLDRSGATTSHFAAPLQDDPTLGALAVSHDGRMP